MDASDRLNFVLFLSSKIAMINPYTLPQSTSVFVNALSASTINGTLIGIGIGLQTCDVLDLSPRDFSPLYGWSIGIAFFGLLGTVVGYLRNDQLAWRWFLLLGSASSLLGATIARTIFAESPLNVYTGVMISMGVCYMLLGAIVGFCHRKKSD